jgi:coenzyme F420-0:L-glutamate ligase/coenzyme F420-1:gamma-L-glutamate ligase
VVSIRITGLGTLPEIQPGQDVASLIRAAALDEHQQITESTVVVVAQKIVSKAEHAIADLRTIEPSPFAARWAEEWGKDARLVELVLRQSRRIVRMDRGVLITETHHGFVTANAGVDRSNTACEHSATLLPADPDASAAALRISLGCGALIISDTFGRPWREGLVNVAIGASGIEPLIDLRGTSDRDGQPLSATLLARADELAAAAGLVMGKAAGVPVALIEGVEWETSQAPARSLIRGKEFDLFR